MFTPTFLQNENGISAALNIDTVIGMGSPNLIWVPGLWSWEMTDFYYDIICGWPH